MCGKQVGIPPMLLQGAEETQSLFYKTSKTLDQLSHLGRSKAGGFFGCAWMDLNPVPKWPLEPKLKFPFLSPLPFPRASEEAQHEIHSWQFFFFNKKKSKLLATNEEGGMIVDYCFFPTPPPDKLRSCFGYIQGIFKQQRLLLFLNIPLLFKAAC